MAGQGEERRDFVRVPFNAEATVTVGTRKIRADHGINVSMNGLCLPLCDLPDSSLPEPGTPCRASIQLGSAGNRERIEAQGRVARSEPGSLAIEFFDVDIDSYEHLRRLILVNADDPDTAERQFDNHWGIRRRP